jgi:hypothetical protein
MTRWHVVNPDGLIVRFCGTLEQAEAAKRSYDNHPVNFGRRAATILEVRGA